MSVEASVKEVAYVESTITITTLYELWNQLIQIARWMRVVKMYEDATQYTQAKLQL